MKYFLRATTKLTNGLKLRRGGMYSAEEFRKRQRLSVDKKGDEADDILACPFAGSRTNQWI
jgi:hypothetical protein